MKSKLIKIKDKNYLRFKPAGVKDYIELPVITKGNRDKKDYCCWSWNGDLEKPTLKPSIKTTDGETGAISHYWLNDGVCKFLNDSTNGFAGKELKLLELKD